VTDDEAPDRNTLARELADLRDEMISVRKELYDAQTTAVQWAQWAEENADKINGPDFNYDKPDNYETMLSEANILQEKLKDYWYDVGYATALRLWTMISSSSTRTARTASATTVTSRSGAVFAYRFVMAAKSEDGQRHPS
jgi:hypothetical protein